MEDIRAAMNDSVECHGSFHKNMQEDIFRGMAFCDIMSLAMILVLSIPRRAFLTPLVYTLMLRTRYNSASGAKYHQPIWAQFGTKVQPYINRAPVSVRKAAAFLQQWFTGRR
jgi:hypothetical protein